MLINKEKRIIYIPGLFESISNVHFQNLKNEFSLVGVEVVFMNWYDIEETNLSNFLLNFNLLLSKIVKIGDLVISHSFGFWMVQEFLNENTNMNIIHIAFDPSLPLKKMLTLYLINYLNVNSESFYKFCVSTNKPKCNYIISADFGGKKIGKKLAQLTGCQFSSIPIHHNLLNKSEARLFVKEVFHVTSISTIDFVMGKLVNDSIQSQCPSELHSRK